MAKGQTRKTSEQVGAEMAVVFEGWPTADLWTLQLCSHSMCRDSSTRSRSPETGSSYRFVVLTWQAKKTNSIRASSSEMGFGAL